MEILSDTTPIYHTFGMNIDSAIPFLDMPQMAGTPDVVIRYGQVPEEIPNAKIKGVRYQAGPGEFLLKVDNVAKYYVSNGSSILVEKEPKAADEEVLLFLMGSAMGALLYQRKILPLHSGAIEVDREAVLFMGRSSIGKSTLAAGFQKRGYQLLADDVCAVTADGKEGAKVIPGFPQLKLWDDALKKLGTKKTGLRRVRLDHDFKKYFVAFDHACPSPRPVRSVFVLNDTNTDRFEVQELKGMDRIEPIINHTYRIRFLEGIGGKKSHFQQCSRLADSEVLVDHGRDYMAGFVSQIRQHMVTGVSDQPSGGSNRTCPNQ